MDFLEKGAANVRDLLLHPMGYACKKIVLELQRQTDVGTEECLYKYSLALFGILSSVLLRMPELSSRITYLYTGEIVEPSGVLSPLSLCKFTKTAA